MHCFRPEEWQYEASARLQALLTVQTLRRLAGELEKAIRAERRAETGRDRPSKLAELADALLVARGSDLFADAEVRKAVVAAVRRHEDRRVDNPRRWHPGRHGAHRFVRETGFPVELAGVRSRARPDALGVVRPPALHRRLKPFQEEVRDRLLETLDRPPPEARAMVSLPTGAGKTRVAVETLHHWSHRLLEEGGRDRVVLVWLAHTEELCEQAVASFEEVWRVHPEGSQALLLARFWGEHRSRLDRQEVVDLMRTEAPVLVLVSTPQSFVEETIDDWPAPAALVIDEAHRAAAPTYRRIIDRHGDHAAIVGLTATPYRREFDSGAPRAGTEALRDLFHRLIVAESLGREATDRLDRLQEMGVLAVPVSRTVNTGITLDVGEPPAEDDDIQRVLNFDQTLGRQADQTRRRRIVLRELLALLEEHPAARVLYFGPSVLDAELVAFLLRLRGHRAAAVSGATSPATRRALIADFRAGRLEVLCNCEVLTTGFDAPAVTHVVMARPTVSQVLYEQMVGRGLRGPEFGGTRICHIVDFEDRYRRVRPVLGYERFREVWMALDEAGEDETQAIGLLVQLGTGDVSAYPVGEDGVAACRSRRAVRHEVRIPVLLRLEHARAGDLWVTVLRDGGEGGEPVSRRHYRLSADRPVRRTRIDLPPGGRLLLQARTDDARGLIEVRRCDPQRDPVAGIPLILPEPD